VVSNILYVDPYLFREDFQFDEHMFRMGGGINHQLDDDRLQDCAKNDIGQLEKTSTT